MRGLVLAAALGFLAAGSARADVGPPKGQKRVALDHKITTEKEFPDYRFYTVLGGAGKGGGFKENANAANAKGVTEVTLDPKTPVVVKGEGRGQGIGRQGSLHAVPKDARKNYESDNEYLAAIRQGKVEGQLRARANLDSVTTVKDTDPRKTVEIEWRVEKVDAKDGFVVKPVFPEGTKEPARKDAPGEDSDSDADTPVASAPKGNAWVAGLAATLGLMLAGLWVARRKN